jgi:hypothetical protein
VALVVALFSQTRQPESNEYEKSNIMSVSKRVMLPLPISHRRIFALLSLFNLNPYVVFTILAFWLPLKRGAVPNEARYSHEQRGRKNVELKIKP